MIGYKIMLLKNDRLWSMADKRINIPLVEGFIWRHQGGIWLGSTINYVQSYYGSLDPDDPDEFDPGEAEARCEFEYSPEHILQSSEGSLYDGGDEFAVEELILRSVFNVTHKQLLIGGK